jgi:predicted enzyme related to lactoylglutathione lyase
MCGVAALATVWAAAATSASLELPPLVQPATQERHPGKVVWVDLVTPDLDGAKTFYAGLFGWTFRDVHSGEKDFVLALLGGRPIGGLVQRAAPKGEPKQPSWLTFISVRDVAEAERVAVAKGAKVLSKVREYPQRGQQEIFADPQGAVFAVLHSTSGDPADVLAEPGEWIWSSLITSDANAGSAFYQALFDYEVFDLKSDDDRDHLLLATDGYARATANSLPANPGKRHPHWLNFVRVVSAKDSAAKAVALGGRVLSEPHTDRHGGMIAVVADPSGAPLGLLEWSDNESKEVAK